MFATHSAIAATFLSQPHLVAFCPILSQPLANFAIPLRNFQQFFGVTFIDLNSKTLLNSLSPSTFCSFLLGFLNTKPFVCSFAFTFLSISQLISETFNHVTGAGHFNLDLSDSFSRLKALLELREFRVQSSSFVLLLEVRILLQLSGFPQPHPGSAWPIWWSVSGPLISSLANWIDKTLEKQRFSFALKVYNTNFHISHKGGKHSKLSKKVLSRIVHKSV